MFPAFRIYCGACFSKREKRPAEAQVFKLELDFLAFPRESGKRRVTATVNPRLPYNVVTLQFLGSLGFAPASSPHNDLGAFTATLPGYCGWRELTFDTDLDTDLTPAAYRADFLVVDGHQSDDVVLGREFKDMPEPLGLMAPTFVVPKGNR